LIDALHYLQRAVAPISWRVSDSIVGLQGGAPIKGSSPASVQPGTLPFIALAEAGYFGTVSQRRMKRKDMLSILIDPDTAWSLNEDRQSVRLSLPPLPLTGQAKPIKVVLDFETKCVDEMIDRLMALRTYLMPPLAKN
jgi:hypothetical protein